MPYMCVLKAICVYYVHHTVLVEDWFRGGYMCTLHVMYDT